MLGLIWQLRAQRIARPIRKPRNNADGAIAPKPEGTGLSCQLRGRSAVASLAHAASHGLRPPSRCSSRKASHAGHTQSLDGPTVEIAPTRRRDSSEWSAENQTLEQPALRLHDIDDRPARRIAMIRLAAHAIVVEAEHRTGRRRTLQDVGGNIERVSLEDPRRLRLERVAFEVERRVEVRVEADSG